MSKGNHSESVFTIEVFGYDIKSELIKTITGDTHEQIGADDPAIDHRHPDCGRWCSHWAWHDRQPNEPRQD